MIRRGITEVTGPYSDEEKEIIKQETERHTPCKLIALKLNRKYKALHKYLRKNNIKTYPLQKGIPMELREGICDLYKEGYTAQEIKDLFYPQFTEDQIGYVVKLAGISRPTGKRVILNHHYFERIDSSDKAYWLGLLTADGSVVYNKNKGDSYSISLGLETNDKYLIERFAKDIETNLSVKDYIRTDGFIKKGEHERRISKLVINSKIMKEDLEKYGVVERKSLKLSELPNIPEEFMKDYVRGFFDGNGSVAKSGDKLHLIFYSTHSFCENIASFLAKKLGIHKCKVTDQKNYNVSLITYGSIQGVLRIYDYLYGDCKEADPYMKRKKEKLEEYVRKHRDNYCVKNDSIVERSE